MAVWLEVPFLRVLLGVWKLVVVVCSGNRNEGWRVDDATTDDDGTAVDENRRREQGVYTRKDTRRDQEARREDYARWQHRVNLRPCTREI